MQKKKFSPSQTCDGGGTLPANRWRACGAALMLGILLATSGCITNPVTGKREFSLIGEKQEISLGVSNYSPSQQAQGGVYTAHPEVQNYVDGVMQKLVVKSERPNLPYEIVVLNNSVPNAWALPGGKMAINRGLLTELQSEAELAAVLSHEIVHVAARHGAKSVERGLVTQVAVTGVGLAVDDNKYRDVIVGASGVGAALVGLKYSRSAELESDKYGIKYMVAAGYDPRAAVDLQQTFVRLANGKQSGWLEGLLGTHPPSQERVDANRRHVSGYPTKGLFMGKEEYRKAMAPLIASKPSYDAMDAGLAALGKDPAKAAQIAEQAIAREPREAQFHGLLAKALVAQNKPEEAIRALNRAIDIQGNYFDFYLTRGRLRKTLGDRTGAQKDLTRSVALLPTASAHYDLGRLALDANQPDRALPHFRMAASADSTEGREALTLLTRLELPAAPERYLASGFSLNSSGFLIVTLQNPTFVNISVCRFSITTAAGTTTYAVPRGLPAGAERTIQTKAGPFPDAATAARQTSMRFDRVTLAE